MDQLGLAQFWAILKYLWCPGNAQLLDHGIMAGKDHQNHQVMVEDGPTHSSVLLETAGGAMLPLLSPTESLRLGPRVNQSLEEAGAALSRAWQNPPVP